MSTRWITWGCGTSLEPGMSFRFAAIFTAWPSKFQHGVWQAGMPKVCEWSHECDAQESHGVVTSPKILNKIVELFNKCEDFWTQRTSRSSSVSWMCSGSGRPRDECLHTT